MKNLKRKSPAGRKKRRSALCTRKSAADTAAVSSLFYPEMSPRCSARILTPRRMRMTPPASCAFFSNLLPKRFPIFTPAAERTKVVIPISRTAGQIETLPAIASEIPTARASIEVATAITNMIRKDRSALTSVQSSAPFFSKASFNIFAPINPNRAKAIQ